MFKVITVLLFSANVQAFSVSFSCTSPENHILHINKVDSNALSSSTNAPQFTEIQFEFDGQVYNWKNLQYMSFPLGNGETATEFRQDATNTLYIQQSDKSDQAMAELKLDRKSIEFECTKGSH